jgi:FkbM family methyltransferase
MGRVDGWRKALRTARATYDERRQAYLEAWRDARRDYSQKRNALDLDHLRVMLGFWLDADANCVDIGANRGSVLEMITARAPRGHHHAFEPLPHRAAELREAFPDVVVHELALTDAPGPVRYTVVEADRVDGYSGITEHLRELPKDWSTHEITVAAARLDDVLPADYVPRFVKIDVEGAELGVLRGAERILRDHRPILFIEHGGRDDTAEFFALVTGLGYAVYDVDGGGPYADLAAMEAGAWTGTGWLWNWVCL